MKLKYTVVLLTEDYQYLGSRQFLREKLALMLSDRRKPSYVLLTSEFDSIDQEKEKSNEN